MLLSKVVPRHGVPGGIMEAMRISNLEHQAAVWKQDRKGRTPIITRKQKQKKHGELGGKRKEGKLICISATEDI